MGAPPTGPQDSWKWQREADSASENSRQSHPYPGCGAGSPCTWPALGRLLPPWPPTTSPTTPTCPLRVTLLAFTSLVGKRGTRPCGFPKAAAENHQSGGLKTTLVCPLTVRGSGVCSPFLRRL